MKIQSIMPLTMCVALTFACNDTNQQEKPDETSEEKEEFEWSGEDSDKEEEYSDKDEDYSEKEEEYNEDEKEEYGDEKEESEDGGECNNSSHSNFRTIVRGGETREFILHVPASRKMPTMTLPRPSPADRGGP